MTKKILYLHGLESPQGGEKVDFLATKAFVHAPAIDYTRNDIFSFLCSTIEEFNPALHSRTLEPNFPQFVKEHFPNEFTVVLGEKDTVIPPNKTLDWLKDHVKDRWVKSDIQTIKTMGHRVPFTDFVDMYNKIVR